MANKVNKETQAYKNKLKYIDMYNRRTFKSKSIAFNIHSEEDMKLYAFYNSKKSGQAFVKELLRKAMEEEKKVIY